MSGGVRLRGEGARFAADLGFLPLARKGAALSVEFGAKAAARRGVKPLSGAYALRIDGSGIALTGYDERGAFYAVQTLRQIAESPAAAGGLPFVRTIPTCPRGVSSRASTARRGRMPCGCRSSTSTDVSR